MYSFSASIFSSLVIAALYVTDINFCTHQVHRIFLWYSPTVRAGYSLSVCDPVLRECIAMLSRKFLPLPASNGAWQPIYDRSPRYSGDARINQLQLENKFNSPNHQIRGETLGTPSYDHQLSDSCCSHAQYICAVIRQFRHQRDVGETYNLATEPSPAAISTHSSSTSTSSATPSVNMMR
jgi:hypothetical protein